MPPPAVSAATPGSQNRMGKSVAVLRALVRLWVSLYHTTLFIIRGSLKRGHEKAGSETNGQVLDSSDPCLNHSCGRDVGCSHLSLCFY